MVHFLWVGKSELHPSEGTSPGLQICPEEGLNSQEEREQVAGVVEGDVEGEEELVTAQIADTQDTHLPPVEAMEPAVTPAAVAGVQPTLSRPTMRKYALSYEFTEYVPHF